MLRVPYARDADIVAVRIDAYESPGSRIARWGKYINDDPAIRNHSCLRFRQPTMFQKKGAEYCWKYRFYIVCATFCQKSFLRKSGLKTHIPVGESARYPARYPAGC